MALFDRFRRRSIRDPAALATFIDDYALVLAETIVQDYSRHRAGDGADALFADQRFRTALDKARWEVYPRAVAMGAALVETKLRAYAGERSPPVIFGLAATILDAFDRRTVPQAIGEVDWSAARAELQRSLNELVHHRPQTVEAAVQEHSSYFLAIMPLHPKLRGDDFQALCQRLKTLLAQFEEAVAQHADPASLTEQLAHAAPAEPTRIQAN
jgi:hypothetical protein